MSRLIDTDALIEEIANMDISEQSKIFSVNMLRTAPTAYDVNEVIRKLEKIKGHYGYYGSEECEYVPYENAIEIVKRGGVE